MLGGRSSGIYAAQALLVLEPLKQHLDQPL
jgi:hypothetical protein